MCILLQFSRSCFYAITDTASYNMSNTYTVLIVKLNIDQTAESTITSMMTRKEKPVIPPVVRRNIIILADSQVFE